MVKVNRMRLLITETSTWLLSSYLFHSWYQNNLICSHIGSFQGDPNMCRHFGMEQLYTR